MKKTPCFTHFFVISEGLIDAQKMCCAKPRMIMCNSAVAKCVNCKILFTRLQTTYNHLITHQLHQVICKECNELFQECNVEHFSRCFPDDLKIFSDGTVKFKKEKKYVYCFNCKTKRIAEQPRTFMSLKRKIDECDSGFAKKVHDLL